MRRIFTFFGLLLLTGTANAGTFPGVFVDVTPGSKYEADVETLLLQGVKNWFFLGIPSENTLSKLDAAGVSVVVALDWKYLTRFQLQHRFDEGQNPVKESEKLARHPSVNGVVYFWCVSDPDLGLKQAATKKRAALPELVHVKLAGYEENTGKRAYELLHPDAFPIGKPIPEFSAPVILDTRLFRDVNASAIRTLIGQLSQQTTVFVDIEWLANQMEHDPLFGLSTSAPVSSAITSELHPPKQDTGFISALLVFIWLLFAMHFYSDPTYRKSIGRFFLNHSFFASDVFNRHIRLSSSGWLVAFQGMVLIGLVLESLFQFVVTPAALEILASNIVLVQMARDVSAGYFFLGFFFQAAVVAISVLWLRIGLPGVRYVSQILPVYAWTFHIHLVVIPLIIVLCISGSSLAVVITWGVLMLTFLTLLSFYIVGLDYIRINAAGRTRVFYFTLLPFTTLLFLIYLLLFNETAVVQSIVYAASLP